MSTELKVPSVGDAITEVEIGEWLKDTGDAVERDEPVAVLESDKASVELPSPAAGVLGEIVKKAGETAAVGDVIGYVEAGGDEDGDGGPARDAARKTEEDDEGTRRRRKPEAEGGTEPERGAEEPGEEAEDDEHGGEGREAEEDVAGETEQDGETDRAEETEEAGGREGGRSRRRRRRERRGGEEAARPAGREAAEERVRMTRLRRTIAERLVEAQRGSALLTTFNEVDMSAVMRLRERYGERFRERHGADLGILSFFVPAVCAALREVPELNARVDGDEIVYWRRYDVGVAVASDRGLVVPVLRSADRLSQAEIERTIDDLARRARKNDLAPDELRGGTFTITNGGVFGSLLSTPLVSPPQSGVLGLHVVQERPVAVDGEVAVRPMMYVALTYDHRVADGREAVTFLRRVKELVEDPPRATLNV